MDNAWLTFIIEFVTGYILQGFSFVLFVYAFNKTKINLKIYLLCSSIMTLFIYTSRNLDINFGVHIILNIILLIFLTMALSKFPITKCTVAAIVATFLMILIEVLDVCALMLIFKKERFDAIMQNPLEKTISAIPATAGLFIVVFIIYKKTTRNKERQTNEVN